MGVALKTTLYVVAFIAFIIPIVFWVYLMAMACAFVTNSSGCGVSLTGFFDLEFLGIALFPWLVSLSCFVGARKLGALNKE